MAEDLNKTIIIYGGVQIRHLEMKYLEPSQWLNDNLVSFAIQYWID